MAHAVERMIILHAIVMDIRKAAGFIEYSSNAMRIDIVPGNGFPQIRGMIKKTKLSLVHQMRSHSVLCKGFGQSVLVLTVSI